MKKYYLKNCKVSSFITIFCLLSFIYCAQNNSVKDNWEGIENDRMKIRISEFFPFDLNIKKTEIENEIHKRIDQRASLILASYITFKIPREKINPGNDRALNNIIGEVLSDKKRISYKCEDNNYCNAEAVYDISKVNRFLESLQE